MDSRRDWTRARPTVYQYDGNLAVHAERTRLKLHNELQARCPQPCDRAYFIKIFSSRGMIAETAIKTNDPTQG